MTAGGEYPTRSRDPSEKTTSRGRESAAIIRTMPTRAGPTSTERRSNLELRAAIDEMLERIRDYRRLIGAWTPEERAQAERELEMIMARIRQTATRPE